MSDYYPIFLNIRGKKCVVVGGGEVAERKVRGLVGHKALILVISPHISAGLAELASQGLIEVARRDYRPGDLEGALVVKSFGQEHRETRQYTDQCSDAFNLGIRTNIWSGLFSSGSAMVQVLAQASILFLGCWLVIDGRMTYGQVLAFVAYTLYLLGPAVNFSSLFNQVEQSMVSVRRVNEVMQAQPDIQDSPVAQNVEKLTGQIELRNLWFSYGYRNPDQGQPPSEPAQDVEYALADVNFTARPGQMVALVGHTGAGKTTLAKLLFRFYDPTRGQVLMDGGFVHRVGIITFKSWIKIHVSVPWPTGARHYGTLHVEHHSIRIIDH